MKASKSLSRPELRIALNTGTGSYPIGAGKFKAGNILIVADEHNPPDRYAYINQPFAGVLSPCSVWLNGLLEEANIPEERLFWINAKMYNGQWIDMIPLVWKLNPSMIIALGQVAHDRLANLGIVHRAFQHPQYWKRFKSKEPYPLIAYLKELV